MPRTKVSFGQRRRTKPRGTKMGKSAVYRLRPLNHTCYFLELCTYLNISISGNLYCTNLLMNTTCLCLRMLRRMQTSRLEDLKLQNQHTNKRTVISCTEKCGRLFKAIFMALASFRYLPLPHGCRLCPAWTWSRCLLVLNHPVDLDAFEQFSPELQGADLSVFLTNIGISPWGPHLFLN